jgi:1-deoxy-D-xylulose-5-phosphate synthase
VQNLPVLFAIDRAGLVGPDGPTHAGSFDLSYLRCIPNMVVMAPADENECRQMLYTGYNLGCPAAVRYPRGNGPGVAVQSAMQGLAVGKAECRRRGQGLAILAFGTMVSPSVEVAEALDATVYNMRFVKPLDRDAVLEAAATHDFLVTVEENARAGGAGSAVNEVLASFRNPTPILNIALPDRFVDQGSREELLAECALHAGGIREQIEHWRAEIVRGEVVG